MRPFAPHLGWLEELADSGQHAAAHAYLRCYRARIARELAALTEHYRTEPQRAARLAALVARATSLTADAPHVVAWAA